MAGELVKLQLRDMYAIKHALQKQVREREKYLNGNGYTVSGRIQAEKDQAHETALIKRMEFEIAEFRDKYRLITKK